MKRSDLIVKYPIDRVILFLFPNRYWAAATFIRMQEFYESPYGELRGKDFDLEKVMDVLADKTGRLDYFSEYCGYNVPDYAVLKFFELQRKYLGRKEKILFDILEPFISKYKGTGEGPANRPRSFYVIGAVQKDIATINHELAHAFFYLNNNYKAEMLGLSASWTDSKKLGRRLLNHGYDEAVLDDEVQAYSATTSKSYMEDIYDVSPPRTYRTIFNRYRAAAIIDKYY